MTDGDMAGAWWAKEDERDRWKEAGGGVAGWGAGQHSGSVGRREELLCAAPARCAAWGDPAPALSDEPVLTT